MSRADVLWVFAPILGSFLVHAPVLRFDLFPSLARPLDGGATYRGRRLFGANKTWRGALAMAAGVVAATLLLSPWASYWSRLPPEIQAAGPLPFGLLLGLGTVLGELPNSFLKRQLDIEPGGHRGSATGLLLAVLDQGDFVFGAWALLAPIWLMSPAEVAIAFVAVVLVHLVVNVIGYALGARKSPI